MATYQLNDNIIIGPYSSSRSAPFSLTLIITTKRPIFCCYAVYVVKMIQGYYDDDVVVVASSPSRIDCVVVLVAFSAPHPTATFISFDPRLSQFKTRLTLFKTTVKSDINLVELIDEK